MHEIVADVAEERSEIGLIRPCRLADLGRDAHS